MKDKFLNFIYDFRPSFKKDFELFKSSDLIINRVIYFNFLIIDLVLYAIFFTLIFLVSFLFGLCIFGV